jgi:hypothetical protein
VSVSRSKARSNAEWDLKEEQGWIIHICTTAVPHVREREEKHLAPANLSQILDYSLVDLT